MRILNHLKRSAAFSGPPLKKGETGGFDCFTAPGGRKGDFHALCCTDRYMNYSAVEIKPALAPDKL